MLELSIVAFAWGFGILIVLKFAELFCRP